MKGRLLSVLENPFLNENVQRMVRPIKSHGMEIGGIVEKESYRKVLDFGCGEGLFCRVFEREKYLGYDRNRRRIEYARRKYPEYSFVSEEMQSYEGIDVILFNNVLHHMREEEVEEIFARIRSECEIGTRVIVLEIYPVRLQRSKMIAAALKVEERMRGSSPAEAEEWLRRAGAGKFAAEKVKDIGGFYLIDMRLKER